MRIPKEKLVFSGGTLFFFFACLCLLSNNLCPFLSYCSAIEPTRVEKNLQRTMVVISLRDAHSTDYGTMITALAKVLCYEERKNAKKAASGYFVRRLSLVLMFPVLDYLLRT